MGANLRNMRLYDLFAPVYRFFAAFSGWSQGEAEYRRAVAEELGIQPGMRVLEVGIGNGAMIPYLPDGAQLFGLDISAGMLRGCQRNLARRDRAAHLFQGEGCKLPFRIGVFDRVFQVGGIHRFANPARAIREMVWVAKPGGKIVIADLVANKASGRPSDADAPEGHASTPEGATEASTDTKNEPPTLVEDLLSLLPAEITDVKFRSLDHGRWFCVTLHKPAGTGD